MLCSEWPEVVTAPLPRGGQMPGRLQLGQVERELCRGEQVFSPWAPAPSSSTPYTLSTPSHAHTYFHTHSVHLATHAAAPGPEELSTTPTAVMARVKPALCSRKHLCVCTCVSTVGVCGAEGGHQYVFLLCSLLTVWCDLFYFHTAFCEQTVLLSSSVCSEHTAARLGSGAGSDTPAKSLRFQPLMFQHCYEAERLTAPVL
ncbi:hypothetical protein AOLI_G00032910 [Acnodon oligacanthus]